MNLFMHKNLKIVLPLLAAAMIAVACDDDNNGVPGEPILPPGESDGGGYEEVEPERPEYVNANLVYYGNDGVSESSDGWVLTLYTDMTVETGYPVGPGQMLSITINATPSPTGVLAVPQTARRLIPHYRAYRPQWLVLGSGRRATCRWQASGSGIRRHVQCCDRIIHRLYIPLRESKAAQKTRGRTNTGVQFVRPLLYTSH